MSEKCYLENVNPQNHMNINHMHQNVTAQKCYQQNAIKFTETKTQRNHHQCKHFFTSTKGCQFPPAAVAHLVLFGSWQSFQIKTESMQEVTEMAPSPVTQLSLGDLGLKQQSNHERKKYAH